MKRLVLLGEGHGEVSALPTLIDKLLSQKQVGGVLYLDRDVIRDSPCHMVKWDKEAAKPDYSRWIRRVELAASRRETGAVLAIFDGDVPAFPAGSAEPFCATRAAIAMAAAAKCAGAGSMFSLSIVFACTEYETWLVASMESLAGCSRDGRLLIPCDAKFPGGDPESHGKAYLMRYFSSYKPPRDQGFLTTHINPNLVRPRVRSFRRLEHALDQLLKGVAASVHISTPT